MEARPVHSRTAGQTIRFSAPVHNPPSGPMTCPVCGEELPSRNRLKKHSATVHFMPLSRVVRLACEAGAA